MKMNDILKLVIILVEYLISFVFLVLYLKVFNNVIFFVLTVGMFFVTLITIHTFGMEEKVKKVLKKVAEIAFNLTIGMLLRAFDALLNMTTGNKNSDLKVITGYEDKVFSVKQRKKKRKANYKSYRLMDNREKVRFLYYKTVTKAVRKGFFFKEADTPFEVNDKLIDRKYLKKSERVLGEIYSVSRYDSESDITDDMVERMKESC